MAANISDLRFSEFDRAKIAKQRALFSRSFPESHGSAVHTLAHYHWKLGLRAGGRKSKEYVAWADDELLGYYAALPYVYQMGEVRNVGAMVCDVMTDPAARGKGIFTGLGRYATGRLASDGFAFTIGYPIRPEVLPGHLKVGWQIVQHLPMYMKVLRSDDFLKPHGLSQLSPPVNALLRGGALAQKLWPRQSYRAALLSRDEFMAMRDYGRFESRMRSQVKNLLVKDAAFMAWRTGAPDAFYDFVTVRTPEGFLVAVAVARKLMLRGIRTLAILDVMIDRDHLGGWRALNDELSRTARARDANVIVTMISREWATKYRLWRFGYIRTPATFSVIVKPLTQAASVAAFTVPGDWHLMWIDSDDL